MLKLLLLLIIMSTLGVGGVYLYQSKQKTPRPVVSETPTPSSIVSPSVTNQAQNSCDIIKNGNADVPPIYKENIPWQEPKNTRMTVEYFQDPSSGTGLISKEVLGCMVEVQGITFGQTSVIRSYYIRETNSRNWAIASSSDLPGEASSDTWTKNGSYLVIERRRDKAQVFYSSH